MKKPGITVHFLSNGRSRTSLLRLPHSQMEYEAGRLQIRTEVRIRAPLSVVWHVVAGSMPEIWCVLPPLGKMNILTDVCGVGQESDRVSMGCLLEAFVPERTHSQEESGVGRGIASCLAAPS